MRDSFGGANIGVRVGAATGSVVAGVIGTSKPSYDIWGETVNLSSRLESNGKVGEVLVCAKTFELLGMGERGVWKEAKVELKGLGMRSAFAIEALDGN
jgi:class 3 adenylate cyclase